MTKEKKEIKKEGVYLHGRKNLIYDFNNGWGFSWTLNTLVLNKLPY